MPKLADTIQKTGAIIEELFDLTDTQFEDV